MQLETWHAPPGDRIPNHPGLILQSPFTSIRDMARLHCPLVPRALVADAYPSLRLIGALQAPLLVLHGERDEIVPPLYGEALYEAATCPKRLEILPGVGHNDLIARAGDRWAEAIAAWAGHSDGTTTQSAR